MIFSYMNTYYVSIIVYNIQYIIYIVMYEYIIIKIHILFLDGH